MDLQHHNRAGPNTFTGIVLGLAVLSVVGFFSRSWLGAELVEAGKFSRRIAMLSSICGAEVTVQIHRSQAGSDKCKTHTGTSTNK